MKVVSVSELRAKKFDSSSLNTQLDFDISVRMCLHGMTSQILPPSHCMDERQLLTESQLLSSAHSSFVDLAVLRIHLSHRVTPIGSFRGQGGMLMTGSNALKHMILEMADVRYSIVD